MGQQDQSNLSQLLSFSVRVQLIIFRFIFSLLQLLSGKDPHEVCLKHVHHHDIRHCALKNASLHGSTQRHGLQQTWQDEAWCLIDILPALLQPNQSQSPPRQGPLQIP